MTFQLLSKALGEKTLTLVVGAIFGVLASYALVIERIAASQFEAPSYFFQTYFIAYLFLFGISVVVWIGFWKRARYLAPAALGVLAFMIAAAMRHDFIPNVVWIQFLLYALGLTVFAEFAVVLFARGIAKVIQIERTMPSDPAA